MGFSTGLKGHVNLKGRYPQLNGDVLEDAILQKSVSIAYFKAVICPCSISETSMPNPACYSCRGLGWFHPAKELDAKYSRAQVLGRRAERVSGRGGSHISGGVSITFQRGVIPGDGDLIQVCADIEVVNNEHHVFGATLTDGSTAEALRFRDVHCVEMVTVYDPIKFQATLLPATQWSFDKEQRRIVFSTPIAVGAKYSVRYTATPEYIILGDTAKPLLRVSKDESLPVQLRDKTDVVYNFNASAIRLDRAISARERGAIDLTKQSTYNGPDNRGPFR